MAKSSFKTHSSSLTRHAVGGLATMLVAGLQVGCKSEESKVRELATSLCQHGQADQANPASLPPDLAKHVRQEDLDFASKKRAAPSPANSGAPPSPSASAAPSGAATCDIQGVDLRETAATVRFSGRTMEFSKGADGWRANLHLPEQEAARVEKETARVTVLKLHREAVKLYENHEWEKAKEKLVEAQRLSPDDEDLKKSMATLEESFATRVAGRWTKRVEKDAMTDKENVYLVLPASNDISTGYASKRPTLTVRCIKGEPDVIITANAVVDGDIYSVSKAQYRFDAEAPQAISMTTAQDHKGVFFREPAKWIDRIAEHAAGKLVVEIPLYGRVPEAATFELAGADKAIPLVKTACTK